MRNETIAKLESLLEEQRAVVGERNARIEELETQLEGAAEAALAQAQEIDVLRKTTASLQGELNTVAAGDPIRDEASLARLSKALALAERMLGDLEVGNPGLFDVREATGEMLTKLRKAVAIAARAAQSV
ncbi:MAG: hypothetical protein A2341_23650 [Deltaproteobacteria bacterium RIFOXYB12_FULL_58_9]|nr:MAG: hypothetical protein A2341_23650 [Deltaproteobacteria bacterium RIFOXYB12_FULL_58_9]